MKSFILNLITRLMNTAGQIINPATEDTLSLVRSRVEEVRDRVERLRIVLGDNQTNYQQGWGNRDIRRILEDAESYLAQMWHQGLSRPNYGLIDTTLPANGSFFGSWIDTRNWGYKTLCFFWASTGVVNINIQASHNGSEVLGNLWVGGGTVGRDCTVVPAGYVRIRVEDGSGGSNTVRLMYKFHVA